MNSNLISMLETTVGRHPDKTALTSGASRLTYRELWNSVERVASLLAREGVSAGDRVVILLPNVPQFLSAYFGTMRLGAVVVPLNPLLKSGEIQVVLEDCGARAVIAWGAAAEFVDTAAAAAGVRSVWYVAAQGQEAPGRSLTLELDQLEGAGAPPQDAPPSDAMAAFLYTSGTTGRPKGAMLCHQALVASAQAWQIALEVDHRDTQIAFLPLLHCFGMCAVMNSTLMAGGTLVLVPRFQAEQAVDLLQSEGVTIVTAVTAMHAAILMAAQKRTQRPDFSKVRLAGAGASSFPPELARTVGQVYACPVAQGWAMTEIGACGSVTPPADTIECGAIGVPLTGMEMAIADPDSGELLADGSVGEIIVRGPSLMSGYYRNAESTQATIDAKGWLHTGDLGLRNADGEFFFVDRTKDVIKRGGLNVYPSELESILYQHPEVKLAAVLGIDDERLGEEVVAVVVRKGSEPIDTDALRDWIRERVAPYKYPRRIVEVDELPLAPSGKILKRSIDRMALFPVPI